MTHPVGRQQHLVLLCIYDASNLGASNSLLVASNTIPCPVDSCDGDPVLADVKQRAWQRDQEAAKSNRLAVMAR